MEQLRKLLMKSLKSLSLLDWILSKKTKIQKTNAMNNVEKRSPHSLSGKWKGMYPFQQIEE